MSSSELGNDFGKEEKLRKDLPDNVGSHLAIGTLFALLCVSHPRKVLAALKTDGIRKSYATFYRVNRPAISYQPLNSKK